MTSNTLIVHSIPKNRFVECAEGLRRAASAFDVVKVVELRSLRRILAVFGSEQAAAAAFPALQQEVAATAPDSNVRVGYSMASVEPEAAPVRLKLPDPGRLLFVSPPVSPPNEWAGEGELEEEPNAATNWEHDFNVQLNLALTEAARGTAPLSPVSPGASPSEAYAKGGHVVRILEAREGQPALDITHE